MCRLLGITSSKELDLEFSLVSGPKPFRDLAEEHPHGWGMGWYEGDRPRIHKEALPATDSVNLPHLAATVASKTYVCHVRRATCGDTRRQNCHPFQYGPWLFAHNGSLQRGDLLQRLRPTYRRRIEGQTDSEVLFHWMLQNIDEQNEVAAGLRKALSSITDFTGLNFILSDSARLYAYRDASRRHDYYSLYYLLRDIPPPLPADRHPGGTREETLRSQEINMLIRSRRLRSEKSVLVCSERLTPEDWHELPLGHILTVDPEFRAELTSLR